MKRKSLSAKFKKTSSIKPEEKLAEEPFLSEKRMVEISKKDKKDLLEFFEFISEWKSITKARK